MPKEISPPNTEGEFRAEEFEEPVLPQETPPAEEQEFEDIEMEMASWGLRPPSEALINAKAKLEQKLLLGVTERALSAESGTDFYGFENIVGVGIGSRMIDGQYTPEMCVTVYVVAKAPSHAIEAEALIPEDVDGIPTDVVVTGELQALPYRGRYRPAPNGVSVGHYRITAGTLGCLTRRGNALYILSNNHVLAVSNNARVGDPILQPGPHDGGRVPADVIARLSQFVPIRFGGPANRTDCAIAQTSPGLVTPANKCVGRISANPVPCRLDLLVKKCGRTTQFTRGRITDCHFTGWVGYGPSGRALF
ncbi:MAG: hypothetical protein FJY85_20520, partial [Deltaproteobacteria bacterium]|nr:hypothetical protein [Deltaproteobacteria bacterium]